MTAATALLLLLQPPDTAATPPHTLHALAAAGSSGALSLLQRQTLLHQLTTPELQASHHVNTATIHGRLPPALGTLSVRILDQKAAMGDVDGIMHQIETLRDKHSVVICQLSYEVGAEVLDRYWKRFSEDLMIAVLNRPISVPKSPQLSFVPQQYSQDYAIPFTIYQRNGTRCDDVTEFGMRLGAECIVPCESLLGIVAFKVGAKARYGA